MGLKHPLSYFPDLKWPQEAAVCFAGKSTVMLIPHNFCNGANGSSPRLFSDFREEDGVLLFFPDMPWS